MAVLENITEAITLMTGTVMPGLINVLLQPPFIYGVGIAIVIAGVGIIKWMLRIR